MTEPMTGCQITVYVLRNSRRREYVPRRCGKPVVYARMQLCQEHLDDRERLLRSAR